MIIMVNGAFGAGKTSVAEELARQLDGSILYDPEMVGYMLREMLPADIKASEAKTGDFQELTLWKNLVVKVAEELNHAYQKTLIVPMTIHKQERFQYIFTGFKNIDPDTHHFCLMARKETIYARLLKRGEEEGNWCFQQTDKCLSGFHSGGFEEYIHTDEMTIPEIASLILGKLER